MARMVMLVDDEEWAAFSNGRSLTLVSALTNVSVQHHDKTLELKVVSAVVTMNDNDPNRTFQAIVKQVRKEPDGKPTPPQDSPPVQS